MLAARPNVELQTPLTSNHDTLHSSGTAKPQDAAQTSATSCTATSSAAIHARPPIIPGLTGLRAILMLHVLVRNMEHYNAVDTLGWMVRSGAVGVSTFFVLSGFILAYCYGDHRFDTWRCYLAFTGRRYARLFLIYLLSQLMCVGEEVNAVRKHGTDVWTYLHWAALLSGTHTWFPWPQYTLADPPDVRGLNMFNPTLWALSCVLIFDVSMPLLMRVMRWYVGVERLSELPRGGSTARLLHLCVLCLALVVVVIVMVQYTGNQYIRYTPYGRLPEFALGLTLAALYLSLTAQQKQQRQVVHGDLPPQQTGTTDQVLDYLVSAPLLNDALWLDVVTCLTIALYIVVCVPSIGVPTSFDYGSWLAPVEGYVVLAIALTNGQGGVFNRLLCTRLLQELGGMSFCFYAFHYVPLTYAESIGLPANRSAAIEFCAGVGLAWLGYRYVETPVYAYLSGKMPSCHCHNK